MGTLHFLKAKRLERRKKGDSKKQNEGFSQKVSDKEGNYDIDGVSQENQKVIIASADKPAQPSPTATMKENRAKSQAT